MKKTNLLRVVSLTTVLALAAAAVSGCGKSNTASEHGSGVTLSDGESVYPVKSDDTLTVWVALNDQAKQNYTNMAETPFGKAWLEKTGVNIKFIHPTSGNVSEQFNLLTVSKDMPDVILYDWYNVSGGPQKYIDDGTILPLNDIIDKYSPNFKAYLEENPDVARAVKTDEGNYYVYPFIRGDEKLTVSCGPIVRKDILDEYGLKVPETIDEWYNTLKTCKEHGTATPLSFLFKFEKNGVFSGAYGCPNSFFLDDDGNVQYGPAQDSAKDYLAEMNKWYKEGLLDNNISSLEQTDIDSRFLTGDVVASIGYAGSSIGTYLTNEKNSNPSFNVEAAPNPVLKKGEKSDFGQKDNIYVPQNSAAITASCKNIELAARFLDYAYSEEGSLLLNFGIEGESYEMTEDGPVYTDLITNNPDGLTMSQALSHYMMLGSGPYVQNVQYIDQYYQYDQQKNALKIWSDTNAAAHKLPQTTFTSEESKSAATITNNLSTYVDEMWMKFITGIEPLDKFDEYQAQLKQLGLEEVLGYYDAALKRYNKRN